MNLDIIADNPLSSIIKYSVPSIISMILFSLVNIVDGYFISKCIGQDALAAVQLGMPISYVYLAIAIMIGVGGVSLAGQRLGRKDFKQSNNSFNQTLATGCFAFVSLSLVFFFILNEIYESHLLDEAVINIINSYYVPMLLVYPFMMLNLILGIFIRCEAKANLFMLNTIIITVINIALDYVFLVEFNLGAVGAAYASGVAVLVGTFMMVYYFISPKTMFYFSRFYFVKNDFIKTLINGSSEFIGQLSFSITLFFINMMIMDRIGLLGVAGMTIIGYSRNIYNMIAVGFGQGLNPMVSVSFGANMFSIGDLLRKYTSRMVMSIGILFSLLLFVYGDIYGQLFTNDPELIALIVTASKIFSLSFIISGFNEIASVYFTSIGYAKQSAIISTSRGLVLLSINILLMPIVFGDIGIWLIAPVTEFMTFLLAVYYVKNNNLFNREEALVI